MALLAVGLLMGGLVGGVVLVRMRQETRKAAWHTSQSVSAVCSGGEALIEVVFVNQDSRSMAVIARDGQTGAILDLGVVVPGETKRGQIETGGALLGEGTVIFELTWTDGGGGSDTRSASYQAVECEVELTPTPTLTPAPTPTPTSGVTPTVTITLTPSPSPTVTPTTTLTPTPTPTPALTPTLTPTPALTPTPTWVPTITPTPTGEPELPEAGSAWLTFLLGAVGAILLGGGVGVMLR